MCKFFSFVSEPEKHGGERFYFDWKYRKEHLKDDGLDSHDHIISYYKLKPELCNCYEYDPLLRKLTIDKINNEIDDRIQVAEWIHKLDFKTIVEPLIIKDIVHPFKLPKVKKPTEADIELLKQMASVWDSVMASVGASVWDSVMASVGASVGDSVWASVGDSVWASVWASVGDSVWASVVASVVASVWDSVGDSVVDSVWDSVGAYYGTFFNIKYKVDITPSNKLWERGIVPSFDGTTWRLHSGKKADVIYEISAEELRRTK